MKRDLIPKSSPIYLKLKELTQNSEIVVFSGLPGVGKSLYVKQFELLAEQEGRNLSIIQWDIARKAFETPEIMAKYPMGAGTVHNGLKIAAGYWLMAKVQEWIVTKSQTDLLLIEAPLVGNRFIEIMKPVAHEALEAYLKSDKVKVVVPIPSREVRKGIEEARKRDVDENSKNWKGAKPSVMLMLWKMLCGIANDLGKNISMEGQPPYDPKVYEFVFSRVLKHRHFVPLHIDEVFDVKLDSEDDLHVHDSLVAREKTANYFGKMVEGEFPTKEKLDSFVDNWYNT